MRFVFFLLVLVFLGTTPFGETFAEPSLNVQDLVVEKYISDLCCMITTMTFVEDDILILQKSDGVVRLIQDGVLQDKPVLDVNVDSAGEKGMSGITSVGSTIYLYYAEANENGEVYFLTGINLGPLPDEFGTTYGKVMKVVPSVTDTYGDGILNGSDVCDGFDDTIDSDNDGIPDGCDDTPNGEDKSPECDALDLAQNSGKGNHKGIPKAKNQINCN